MSNLLWVWPRKTNTFHSEFFSRNTVLPFFFLYNAWQILMCFHGIDSGNKHYFPPHQKRKFKRGPKSPWGPHNMGPPRAPVPKFYDTGPRCDKLWLYYVGLCSVTTTIYYSKVWLCRHKLFRRSQQLLAMYTTVSYELVSCICVHTCSLYNYSYKEQVPDPRQLMLKQKEQQGNVKTVEGVIQIFENSSSVKVHNKVYLKAQSWQPNMVLSKCTCCARP